MTQFETLGLRAVIFDMDGLLFDTESLYLEAWPHVGKRIGFPITTEVARTALSLPMVEQEVIFQSHYGMEFTTEVALPLMADWLRARIEAEGMPMQPGVHALLALLRERNIPFALGTSNLSQVAEAYLERADLLHYFDIIVSGDMVNYAKPAPDIFLLAASRLGVAPSECLVLEDSPVGVLAAHRAGCVPVMIPDLIAPDAETIARAWRVLESLEEVPDLLFG